MTTLIEITGWIGTALILLAYLLNSMGRIESKSTAYQVMNLMGATGVAINVFTQKAWPAFTLETIWAAIALISLLRIRR